jgi:putative ABC transport system permease protein
MNKFIRNKFIVGIIFFLIGVVLIGKNTSNIEENIPSITECSMTSDKTLKGVKFSEFSAVSDILVKAKVTAYSEVLSEVSTEYKKYDKPIKAILTDENHCTVYKKEFIKGGNFDSYSKGQGEKLAIISDKMSLELFKSYDGIGNKIIVLGQNYMVIGIYKTDDSFIGNISGDGVEQIIVPYTSYGQGEELLLNKMAVNSEEVNKSDFQYSLRKVVGEKLDNYKIVDYKVGKSTVIEIKYLVFFIIGCILIVLIIRLLIKVIKKEYHRLLKHKDKYYFMEIIKKEKKSLIITVVISIALIIGIVLIVNFIRFDLVAPEGYIPKDNIFDITFYKDTFIKNIQLINSDSGFKLSSFDRYLSLIHI